MYLSLLPSATFVHRVVSALLYYDKYDLTSEIEIMKMCQPYANVLHAFVRGLPVSFSYVITLETRTSFCWAAWADTASDSPQLFEESVLPNICQIILR